MKYFFYLFVFISFSCGQTNDDRDQAIGLPGKINIVMTPELWNDTAGRSLNSLLSQEMTVLPRPEAIFKTRFVDPEMVNNSMRRTCNLIFVFAMDDDSPKSMMTKRMLTAETLSAIQQDTSLYMKAVTDLYAFGQEVLFIFGPDAKTLTRNIKRNRQKIVDNINLKERTRFTKGQLNATTTKNITQRLEKDKKFSIKVPFGYKVADDQKDFVWLRQINAADDKDIFIARKPYTSQDDFKKEKLVAYRNDICRKYLFEDPEIDDTYLVTETEIPDKEVEARELNFNGLYAVELKGLWRSNQKTMGGPFMGIALVDEKNHQFYYIEGFTYSPSKDQREIMRELECILYTFKMM